MENVSMTQSYYVPSTELHKSPKVSKTLKTPVKQVQTANKTNPDVQSLFFDNVNRSYLAKISQKSKSSMKKEKLYKRPTSPVRKRKKIDFQAYQELETEKIYESSLFKGQWDMFQVISLLENSEKQIQLNDQNDRFLCCAGPKHKLLCKAKITGPTQLELIKQVAGMDCGMFFSINFDVCKGQIFFHQHKISSEIIITVDKFSLILEPFDRRAGRWWNSKLQQMAQSGIGTQVPQRILTKNPSFYNTRYETQSYFIDNCQNGDILLFQDNHFFAKAQRFITRSQFDHVGIVVRDKKHGILIFQSNTSSGVCLTPWKYVNMFEWYKNIPRITWRRLHTDRKMSFDKQLQNFVVKNLPRQFHFSLAKLAASESFIMVNENDREGELELGQTNGYFCSQLVAATYKHLGLLTSQKDHHKYLPASRYYPVDFTQKGQLLLQNGYLSEERDIIFENEMK